jgi:hypothetical protein
MPKDRSSLLNKDAVPMTGIMHGTHEMSLHTVQAMFGSLDGFTAAWTPMYFGPGLPCKAFADHATKRFLKPVLPYPLILFQTFESIQRNAWRAFKGHRAGNNPHLFHKERSRVWKLEGVIESVLHKGLLNKKMIFHYYL